MSPEPSSDPGPELSAWRDNAATWIAHGTRTAAMTRGASEALVEALDPQPGARLLDVASGAGDPALQLARLVGPRGHVLAIDGVAEMLVELRRRADELGLPWLHTREASAEQLAFDARDFDAAGCRFGVMFFEDPARGLANMAAAVRPSGTLAVVAWGLPAHNPYFTLSSGVLDELGAPPVPAGKTVFEFADGKRLVGLAAAAGWTQVQLRRVPFTMVLPEVTPDTLLEAHRSLSRKVAQRLDQLAALDAGAVSRAHALVARRAAPYAAPAGLALPAECLLVQGLAPD